MTTLSHGSPLHGASSFHDAPHGWGRRMIDALSTFLSLLAVAQTMRRHVGDDPETLRRVYGEQMRQRGLR